MFNLVRSEKKPDGLKKNNIRKLISKLKTADIILVHTKGSLLSSFIRRMSKSYWNHTAIVFTSFDEAPEYKTVMVAEATEGIVVHSIDKFLDTSKYDIGIKRVKWLTREDCEKIRNFILYNVDMPYDVKRLANDLLKILFDKPVDWLYNTDEFLCSSYVQKAYYYSLTPNERKKVVFLKKFVNEKDLEFISPAEIARSSNCEWVYNKR